jgi:Uma2 family endonuclease
MVADLKDLPRRHYTLEEYFALEHTGQARYEYWDGDLVCMSGGTPQHAIIGGNVFFCLRNRLQDSNCRAFNGDLAIRTPSLPPYRYPDASVACGQPIYETVEGMGTLTNPVLIVEVLSRGTEALDRHQKKDAYQALPTVREYLLVAQDAPHVTHYVRHEDGWNRTDHADLLTSIELPSLDISFTLADLYEGIEFN